MRLLVSTLGFLGRAMGEAPGHAAVGAQAGGSGPAVSGARSQWAAVACHHNAFGRPLRFRCAHRHREWHLRPQTHYPRPIWQ